MAPEILFNARGGYTAKADLWSVGCIMFELLYGRAPYGSAPRSTEADLRRDITEDKRFAREPPPSLSEACRELLEGLLRRDPTDRIAYEGLFDHSWLGGGGGAQPAPGPVTVANRGRGVLISGKYVMSKALLGEGSFATVSCPALWAGCYAEPDAESFPPSRSSRASTSRLASRSRSRRSAG